MSSPEVPSYEEWVDYAFTFGHSDFSHRARTDEPDEIDARVSRFDAVDQIELVRYATRLFESPEAMAARYSDEQLAGGVWYVFGVSSGCLTAWDYGGVPLDLQMRCVRSVGSMYTGLLDKVCGRRGTDPDADLKATSALDGAVYMIWEMDNALHYFSYGERHTPERRRAQLDVLRTVLVDCRTSTCHLSALYCLNNLAHQSRCFNLKTDDIADLIHEFLRRPGIPEWLLKWIPPLEGGPSR